MPIRFRCVYCDKLLGIAKRKAGTIVDCPGCEKKLIVPTVDQVIDSDVEPVVPEPAKQNGRKASLFERDDYEALLENDGIAKERKAAVVQSPVVQAPPPPLVNRLPESAAVASTPVAAKVGAPVEGILLTAERMNWLVILAVGLCAISFVLGLIIGKMLK
jgi:hypothetical protein